MAVLRKTTYVEGLSELEDALEDLPAATARNVLRRTLIAAGQPIASHAARLVRRLTGTLEKSHTVGTKLSRRQRAVHKLWAASVPTEKVGGFFSKPDEATYVFVGPGPLPQAITEEFGKFDQAPHPSMRPAWDAEQNAALEAVKRGLRSEIDKATERLARKAARLAAKVKAGK